MFRGARREAASGGELVTGQPRERLRTLGARALSSQELLAIIIGGTRDGATAEELSQRILTAAGGSVRRLEALSCAALEATRGVGSATSARLLAAIELGRRAHREEVPERQPIRGPGDVFRLMGPALRGLQQEEFHALLLNTRHRVLRSVLVTRGTLDAALIHPREVFRPAVSESAAGVVLVHNHPSGDPRPSPEDHVATRQLAEAGQALGIPVLDHVILGEGRFISMAEEGLL